MRPPKAKMLSRNLVTALFLVCEGWCGGGHLRMHIIVSYYFTTLYPTANDNKHLFNGLVLTRFASLQRNTKTLHYGSKANRQQRNKRLRQR